MTRSVHHRDKPAPDVPRGQHLVAFSGIDYGQVQATLRPQRRWVIGDHDLQRVPQRHVMLLLQLIEPTEPIRQGLVVLELHVPATDVPVNLLFGGAADRR